MRMLRFMRRENRSMLPKPRDVYLLPLGAGAVGNSMAGKNKPANPGNK